MLVFFFTSQTKAEVQVNPTCAQVRYLRDLSPLVDHLVERADDPQELLHLVRHGHALQDLHVQGRNTVQRQVSNTM